MDEMGDSVVIGVTEAISEVKNIEPINLDLALENHVDVDALQQLARHDSRSWAVSFETPNHLVTVSGSGWVSVDNERILRWDSHNEQKGETSFLRNSATISGD